MTSGEIIPIAGLLKRHSKEQNGPRLALYQQRRWSQVKSRRYFPHFIDDTPDKRRVSGTGVVQKKTRLAVQKRRLKACLKKKPPHLLEKVDAVDAFAQIVTLTLERLPLPGKQRRSSPGPQEPGNGTAGRRAPGQHRALGVSVQIRNGRGALALTIEFLEFLKVHQA